MLVHSAGLPLSSSDLVYETESYKVLFELFCHPTPQKKKNTKSIWLKICSVADNIIIMSHRLIEIPLLKQFEFAKVILLLFMAYSYVAISFSDS